MRISDWSSDVCSSDLLEMLLDEEPLPPKVIFAETLRRCQERSVISEQDVKDLRKLMTLRNPLSHFRANDDPATLMQRVLQTRQSPQSHLLRDTTFAISMAIRLLSLPAFRLRSEEHTSELQSLMRISYAVFCLKKKIIKHTKNKPY